jgi:hypothetical protein
MPLQPLDIIILRGNWYNPMTGFIYHRTSTAWSHGTIVSPDPRRQYEAVAEGVKITDVSKYAKRPKRVLRANFTIHDPEKLLAWLYAQLGKHYEWRSYLGYITGIKTAYLNDPDQFVCIELASDMFTRNGYPIWGCERPTYIYPSDFLQNPYFIEVTP